MRHSGWPIRVALGCMLALQPELSFGQPSNQNPQASQSTDRPQSLPPAPSNQDAAFCAGDAPNADAGVEACSKLLDREAREFAQRRAIALTYRALAWKAKGSVKEAANDLKEAIGLDENFTQAYEALADLLRENDQCDLALPGYDHVIALVPERALAYIGRALCLSDKNRSEEARSDLDRVAKLDAANADGYAIVALGLKARLDVAKNDFDSAFKNFDQAIALDPKRIPLYLDRATAWGQKGDQKNALADLDRAIGLDPTNAEGYAVTARVFKASLQTSGGNLDAALAEYDEAIKLDPKRSLLYTGRAIVWRAKGNADRELADYGEAIKADPTNVSALNVRGDFYRSQGNYQLAMADYDLAIEKRPNDITAYRNRGLARFYQGDFAKAIPDFKRIADAQENGYSRLLLYISKSRDGDAREARTELTKSASKLKASEWPYPIVEFYLGKKSLKALEDAAKTPGEKCEAQFYVGEWHLSRKDRPEAIKALQSAADNCPKDFVESRAAIEELKRLK